ncbi:MAG: fibronectin type III domain-containing protein, partial [Thermoplasmata archaeon]|nr:fibronectin type III domain-containing protein [Thermoplasmata archaeon]
MRSLGYFGGSRGDTAYAITTDDDGNIYVGGFTFSADIPTTPGCYDDTRGGDSDGFVAKFDPTGSTLIFSTYIGGSDGEYVYGLDVDNDGYIYITGMTYSDDFPTTSGAFCQTFGGGSSDAYITKLDYDGSRLLYSTFIGGNGDDRAVDIHVTDEGQAIIVGETKSDDFPTTAGCFDDTLGLEDMFATKLSSDGSSLVFSTFVGGPSIDYCRALAVDIDGGLVMTGMGGRAFPTTQGAYCETREDREMVVLKLDRSGSDLVYATFIPDGSGTTFVSDVGVLPDGTALVGGFTASSDYPTTADAYQKDHGGDRDGFITAIGDNGTEMVYSTLLGSTGNDRIHSMDLSTDGRLLAVTGLTSSLRMPVTEGAFDIDANGGLDAYIAVFDLDNSTLEYCTYIGGANHDDMGEAISMDGEGVVYVAGRTLSDDLPTTGNAYCQARPGSTWNMNIFLAKVVPKPGAPPSKPTDFQAVASEWEVFLQWDRPADYGGCVIMNYSLYRFDGVDWVMLYQGTDLSLHDADVVNGRTYRYRVTAWSNAGEGDPADTHATVWLTIPQAPVDLIVSTGNGTVTLNWTPPDDTGGGRIKGYVVHRGPLRDTLDELALVGNVTSFVDADVVLGEFYYYMVAARNDARQGPFSDIQRVKALGLPAPPKGFKGTAGDDFVQLNWQLPTETGGSMLLGVKVWKRTGGDEFKMVATKVASLSHRDTNVTNGMTYVYYLTAYTDVGESVPTTALDMVPFGLPGRVLDLIATAGDGNVTLEWSYPDSDGGSQITRYMIYAGEGSAGNIVFLSTLGNVTRFVHSDLVNGVTHFFEVTAVNEAGEGHGSETVSARPMGLPGPVEDLRVVNVKGGIQLTWEEPQFKGGASIVTYEVLRGLNADELVKIDSLVDAVIFLDVNITPGSTYHYSVRTRTSVGEGTSVPPIEITMVTAPGPVRDLVTFPNDGRVELTWKAPEDDGGGPITVYIVKRGIFVTGIVEVARVTTLSYTDTGLDNGKEYLFVVVAVNSLGAGAETDPVEGKPLGPPAAPGLFKAEAKGKKVVLTWAKPSGSDRAPVTGYRILRAMGEGAFEEIASVGDVTSYTDETVKEGKRYSYKVVSLS